MNCGIPLQTLRSSGTSSQTSAKASEERRTQITTDLANGVYECAVCSDPLNIYSDIWSCEDCHNLFHHRCIHKWAHRSGRFAWPCPTCKAQQADPGFYAKCWCGKVDKHSLYRPNGLNTGNSCGGKCEKLRSCPERTCGQMCKRTCHPGSCDEVKCNVGCKSSARAAERKDKMPLVVGVLPREPRPYRRPEGARFGDAFDGQAPDPTPGVRIPRPEDANWFQRLVRRWNEDVSSAKIGDMFTAIIFVAFFNGLGALWAVKKAGRTTRPLQHQEYTENPIAVNWEFLGSILLGIPFIVMPAGLAGISFAINANAVVMKTFGLTGKSFRLFLVRALLFLFTFGSFVCYIILQIAFPIVTWKKQFEHGCDGFDAALTFDKIMSTGKSSYLDLIPDTIQLHDPRLGQESFEALGINSFEFSTPVDISKLPTDNFHSFHRMTGATNTRSLAIDFDLHHQTWRMLDLSPSSTQQTHLQTLETSAILTDSTSNLLNNGTWNQPTLANPHLTLPELNLLIPAFRLFQRNCHYQPFMKVYNISGMSEWQINDVRWRQWSGESEEGVVMRTKSYKEGGPLSLCYRKDDYDLNAGREGGARDMSKGLGDEGLVPMGLMAVTRLQLAKDGKAGGCGRK